jgi:hypothetical protein
MGFWSDFGNVAKNIGILALKTIGTIVSVAGAIASEGLTAPIATVSFLSTASSWFDFIKNPTGNVNRTIINSAEWVAKTIGHAGSGDRVLSLVSSATVLDPFTQMSSSVGLPAFSVNTNPGQVRNLISHANNAYVANARAMGRDTASHETITRLVSHGVRSMAMARGNVVDRTRYASANAMTNVMGLTSRGN